MQLNQIGLLNSSVVQFSCSVVSDSLWPYESQHARSSLRLTSMESVMLSSHLIFCHPLLLLPQIPPSIKVFSNESTLCMRWPKYWSFSFSISPSNEYSGLILTGWIPLQSKGLSRLFSNTTVLKHQFFSAQLSLYSNSHIHTWLLETIALTSWTLVGKVMSLLLDILSRLVITFLTRSKHLLISWLQSPSAVILEPPKIKSDSFYCFPVYLPWSDGTDAMIFVFWMLSFKPTFSLSSFTFIKRLFSSSSLFALRVVSSA